MADTARARELAALFVSIERPQAALIPQALPFTIVSLLQLSPRPIVDCLRDPAKPSAQFPNHVWALYRFPWAAGLDAYLTLDSGNDGPEAFDLRIYDSSGTEPLARAELYSRSSDCGAGFQRDTVLIDLDGDGVLDLAMREHTWDSHQCEDWDGGNEDETKFVVYLWKGMQFAPSDSFPEKKIKSLFESAGHAMFPELPRDQRTLLCGTALSADPPPPGWWTTDADTDLLLKSDKLHFTPGELVFAADDGLVRLKGNVQSLGGGRWSIDDMTLTADGPDRLRLDGHSFRPPEARRPGVLHRATASEEGRLDGLLQRTPDRETTCRRAAACCDAAKPPSEDNAPGPPSYIDFPTLYRTCVRSSTNARLPGEGEDER
jgi:hypothetical protein